MLFTVLTVCVMLFNNNVCYVNSPCQVLSVNSPCQDLTACHHVYIFVLLDTFCTKLCWTYTEISATISTLFALVYRIQLIVQ